MVTRSSPARWWWRSPRPRVAWIVARETNWWAPVLAGGAALAAAARVRRPPVTSSRARGRVRLRAPDRRRACRGSSGRRRSSASRWRSADVWHSLGIIGAAVFGVGLAAVLRGRRRVRRAAVGKSRGRTVDGSPPSTGAAGDRRRRRRVFLRAARLQRACSTRRRGASWRSRRRRRPRLRRWQCARSGSGGSRRGCGHADATLVLAAVVTVVVAYPAARNQRRRLVDRDPRSVAGRLHRDRVAARTPRRAHDARTRSRTAGGADPIALAACQRMPDRRSASA